MITIVNLIQETTSEEMARERVKDSPLDRLITGEQNADPSTSSNLGD